MQGKRDSLSRRPAPDDGGVPAARPLSARTGAVVLGGMLLLAVLGVVTIFYEPLGALLVPTDQRRAAPTGGDMDK